MRKRIHGVKCTILSTSNAMKSEGNEVVLATQVPLALGPWEHCAGSLISPCLACPQWCSTPYGLLVHLGERSRTLQSGVPSV